jgi:hypothetical protein
MKATFSFKDGEKAWTVVCLIDNDLKEEIRAQVLKGEKHVDDFLRQIWDCIPSMLVCWLHEDPSRPTLSQLFIAFEEAYTLDLPISAAAVRNRQCMEEFLNEHSQEFVRQRPEYSLVKTTTRKTK